MCCLERRRAEPHVSHVQASTISKLTQDRVSVLHILVFHCVSRSRSFVLRSSTLDIIQIYVIRAHDNNDNTRLLHTPRALCRASSSVCRQNRPIVWRCIAPPSSHAPPEGPECAPYGARSLAPHARGRAPPMPRARRLIDGRRQAVLRTGTAATSPPQWRTRLSSRRSRRSRRGRTWRTRGRACERKQAWERGRGGHRGAGIFIAPAVSAHHSVPAATAIAAAIA